MMNSNCRRFGARGLVLAGLWTGLSCLPPAAWAAAPSSACQAPLVVALDVGHTLTQPGATSARGRTEYAYNKALAETVLETLHGAGYGASFIVEPTGAPVTLQRRPAIAAERGAAVLISLHHDSVQPRYLLDWDVDGHRQRYSDLFHGYSIFVSEKPAPNAAASLALAQEVAAALRAAGLQPTLHHAADIPGERRALVDPAAGIYHFNGLVVLRTATMPAMLLESAVIVNRDEEQTAASPAFRLRVSQAILAGLKHWNQKRCGD